MPNPNLGSVRISHSELLLFDAEVDRLRTCRTDWVNLSLEHVLVNGLSASDLDSAMAAGDRLAREDGGREDNLSSVRTPRSRIMRCQQQASAAKVARAAWIRAALWHVAVRKPLDDTSADLAKTSV